MKLYSSSEVKAISDIICTLRAASTTDDLSGAIAGICQAVDAEAGSIVLVREDGRGAGMAVLYNIEEEFYDKYRKEFFAKDDVFPRAMARGLQIWRPTDIVTQKEWESSDLYTGLLRPRGIFHTLVAAFGTALAPTGLMFLARGRQDEPFSDDEVKFVEVLHPHLEAALRVVSLNAMTDRIGASLILGVDTVSRPVYILNERNAPIYINSAARRMCPTVGLTESEMLSKVGAALEVWNSFGAPGSTACNDAFLQIAGHQYGLYSVVVKGSATNYRVVMLVGGMAFMKLSIRVLAARHGLTERESEVSAMLAQGLTNKEIAGELFISDQTVKDHVKAVLTKLKLKCRAEVPPLIVGLLQEMS